MRSHTLAALTAALLLSVLLLAATAQAQTPASVSGTVVAPNGQPLIGAIVELTQGGRVLDADVTSFDGRFTFPGLKPGGSYEVFVHMPDSDPLRSGVFDLSPGQTMDATVTYE